ncbi:MAG: hypothetical protein EP341_10175 [Sphingomonadales bacterium]|nr:MAG: hypothetical protein EP341_10175 [Sphingomonadales bacterium]
MQTDISLDLPAEQRIALAYTPAHLRAMLATYFALDRRLGQLVSKTNEPLLGQVRLAWWRDTMSKRIADRPPGDAVLDAIGEHWIEREHYLIALVDGWEVFLMAEELTAELVGKFAKERAAPFAAIFAEAKEAGRLWAFADAVSHLSESTSVELANGYPAISESWKILPRSARGIAVLDALAARSLNRGGRPLMEGRGASLLAFRVGLLGR